MLCTATHTRAILWQPAHLALGKILVAINDSLVGAEVLALGTSGLEKEGVNRPCMVTPVIRHSPKSCDVKHN